MGSCPSVYAALRTVVGQFSYLMVASVCKKQQFWWAVGHILVRCRKPRCVVFVRLGCGTALLREIHEQDRDMTYDVPYVAGVSCETSCET